MSAHGVQKAIDAAGGNGPGHRKLAEMFGTSVQFIYNAKRKGWLPPERARMVMDTFGVPMRDLVHPDIAALLDAQ